MIEGGVRKFVNEQVLQHHQLNVRERMKLHLVARNQGRIFTTTVAVGTSGVHAPHSKRGMGPHSEQGTKEASKKFGMQRIWDSAACWLNLLM